MKKLILSVFIVCVALSLRAQTVGTVMKGSTVQTNSFTFTTQPAGKIFLLTGYSATNQYIMAFTTNAIPPAGTRGILSVPVLSDQYYSIDFGYYGLDADRITICTSTSPYVYAPGGTNATFQVILRR